MWLALGGLFAAAAVFFTTANLASVLARQSESQTRVYDRDVSQLVVDSSNGDLTILASEDDKVHVERRLEWSYRKPHPTEEFMGDTLRLRNSCDLHFITECEVDYVVRVPAATTIDARTGSGDLEVRNLTSNVRVSSGSGDISVTDVGGSAAVVDVRTGSGDIEVATARGNLAMRTGSGDIDGLRLSSPQATARTGSGDIDLQFSQSASQVSARTGSGDVDIAVPPGADAAYDVEISTGSGDERVEIDDDPQSRQEIVVRTGSGDVTVFYFGP